MKIKFDIPHGKLILGASALTAILIASGCGSSGNSPSNFVKSVSLNSYLEGTDNDQWVSLKATLSTGGFAMTSFNLPITDPKDKTKHYGTVGVVSGLCSGTSCVHSSDLTIALNLTDATKAQTLPAKLPNGTDLPVGGLSNATVIALPIAQNDVTNSQIYFAFGPGVAMLGTALAFSALDTVGHYVPGINLFQPFRAGPVSLTAGIFAGDSVNTTGIGLFVDLSSVMNKPAPTSASARIAAASSSVKSSPIVKSLLTFRSVKPSALKAYRLGTKLNSLSRMGLKLSVLK